MQTQIATTQRQAKKKRRVSKQYAERMVRKEQMGEPIQSEYNRMFNKLYDIKTLKKAFNLVKRNKGAAGVDNITIKQYEQNLEENLRQLSYELISWIYEPKPVKKVEIPKPKGGTRILGIPCVKDRVIQAAIKTIIEPILDKTFSESSYGFRPNRNQKQAVHKAQETVKRGKIYVVDIDLAKFFDKIHHDRLIGRLRNLGIEKELLRLIGKTLRSGIIHNECGLTPATGSPQGSPLSPLLSNVVLDELDKELEKRGLEFCRFADDCKIYTRSYKAANRVMESVSKFITRKLRLEVNKDKSKVTTAKKSTFLGMVITATMIMISPSSMKIANARTKELVPRRSHLTIEETIERTNRWYMGWSAYYRMTQQPRQLLAIEAHIRRRIRARIVAQQKTRRSLTKKLIKRGLNKRSAHKTCYSNKGIWALSHTRGLEKAFPNAWFIEELGQKIRSNEIHTHWPDYQYKVDLITRRAVYGPVRTVL